MKDELILKAIDFASVAHQDQVRKYTGEPYIFHPIEVAQIVWSVLEDAEAAAAAILHDVVEDTAVTEHELRDHFGDTVTNYVMNCTKASKKSDGNRAFRKEKDRKHYSKGCSVSQSIKLADVISNSSDVAIHDPEFAKVYLVEQSALVSSLTDGHPTLQAHAEDVIAASKSLLK